MGRRFGPEDVQALMKAMDMRKQYDVLQALAGCGKKADPLFGDLFLLRNRRCTRAKVLL